jgi:sensor histidine kinase YesM
MSYLQNMKCLSRLFLAISFFLGSHIGQAQKKVLVKNSIEMLNLSNSTEYWEDSSEKASFQTVAQPFFRENFKIYTRSYVNLGVTESAFWLRFTLQNDTEDGIFLKIDNTSLHELDVYEKDLLSNKVIHHPSGDLRPFSFREFTSTDYLYKLNIHPHHASAIYLRVKHPQGIHFKVSAGTLPSVMTEQHEKDFLQGIYFGFMILMVCYNLFIYITIRDKSYIYYVVYILFMSALNGANAGFTFEYLHPNFPIFNKYLDVYIVLTGISGTLFAAHFLNTKKLVPRYHNTLLILIGIYSIALVVILSQQFMWGLIIAELASFISVFSFIATGIAVLRKGYRPAKFFIIAWSQLLTCVIIFILNDYGWVPDYGWVKNALQIGSAMEAMLLSMALADKINTYREDALKAQLEVFHSHEEHQKLLFVRQQDEAKFQQKIAEIEMNALRAQMNPHFIFNCLNSIKLYSMENNSDAATSFLSKFSRLIRLVLENSRSEKITLKNELETLRLYIEMEAMRFKNKVGYRINVEEDIDQQFVEIPPLLLQPFVENSIWHGLMHKDEGGEVIVNIKQENDELLHIEIIDNGIGRKQANEYKSKSAIKQKSFGMKVTAERIELINHLYNTDTKVTIEDLMDENGEALGTRVIIIIPI